MRFLHNTLSTETKRNTQTPKYDLIVCKMAHHTICKMTYKGRKAFTEYVENLKEYLNIKK